MNIPLADVFLNWIMPILSFAIAYGDARCCGIEIGWSLLIGILVAMALQFIVAITARSIERRPRG